MFAHLLGTCVKISAAPWQLPKKKRFWPQEKSEFGIAQRSNTPDISLLYILILKSYGKLARKNKMLVLGVCFPQTCSSAGRIFPASRSHLHYYWQIISFPKERIRWNALWSGFHWESASVQEIPIPTLKQVKHGKYVGNGPGNFLGSYRINLIIPPMVDFSCVGGLWIKKQVAVQVSVGVVDLGHEGGWWIELGVGWRISLVCWGGGSLNTTFWTITIPTEIMSNQRLNLSTSYNAWRVLKYCDYTVMICFISTPYRLRSGEGVVDGRVG